MGRVQLHTYKHSVLALYSCNKHCVQLEVVYSTVDLVEPHAFAAVYRSNHRITVTRLCPICSLETILDLQEEGRLKKDDRQT